MKITHIVIDVDGTMTDGGIYYDNSGNEFKKFNTRDAVGFFKAKEAEIKIIVMTGRESLATQRRMEELKVDYLFQDVKDKKAFLQDFMRKEKVKSEELAYIGDDLNDYEAMQLAGVKACPYDACDEIKAMADIISEKNGGDGAVRDCILKVIRL